MSRAARFLPPSIALLAALAFVPATRAVGDDGVPDAEEEGRPPFSVRDTNAARYALEGASAALKAGEVARGVREIQQVLDHFKEDLVDVRWEDEQRKEDPQQTRWIPAPEAARRLLESRGSAVREAYERFAVPQGGPELLRAAERKDEAALSDVLARYGAASIGVTAARLLAEAAFEAGRPRDAAAAAARGLRFAPADADLWLRRIDALEAQGDGDALAALSLPPDAPETASTALGPVRLAERLERARTRVPPPAETQDWPAVAGGPAHDRPFPADVELKERRWAGGDRVEQRQLDDPQFPPLGRDDSATPFLFRWPLYEPLLPAMRDRVLYVSDGTSVSALDLLTGRRRWTFPSESGPPSGLDVPPKDDGPLRGRTCLDRAEAPAVAGDLVYATIEVSYPYSPRHLNAVEISTYMPRRTLVALDAATGEVRWRAADAPLDRLRLKDVSIVSAPVVADGLVAAVGVRRSDNMSFSVSLLAFDAATGRLRWMKDEIVVGQQELNLFGEPVKELFAGIPAVLDGVLYAATGLGVLAAADLMTGEIRWMSTYDAIPVERVQYWYHTPLRTSSFGPSPVVAHGDACLVAPPDGMSLSCYDRADGRLRWRVPAESRRAGGFLDHFLGVVRDSKREVAIVTGQRIRAIDLATGKEAWHAELTSGERPIGRGALTKTTVYVPTDRGLSRFSVPGEGRYLEPAPWPEGAEPGNVFPFPQVLVVAGRGDFDPMETRAPVQAFFAWEDIERSLASRRQRDPKDPALALEAADLWRVVGHGDRAEAAYQEALRLADASPDQTFVRRARQGLLLVHRERGDAALADRRAADAQAEYEAALKWAPEGAPAAELRWRLDQALSARGLDAARIRNLETLAQEAGKARIALSPAEGPVPARAAARFRLAEIHRAAGRPVDAVDALQKVLAEDGDERFGEETARARAKREVDRVLAEEGRGAYRRHEEAAQALLADAVKRHDAALFRRLLDEYPNAAVVPEAIVGLADRRIEEGSPVEAAATLRSLLAAWPDHALVPRALAGLAKALAAAGSPVAARAALSTLERRYADSSFTIDGAPSTGRAFAEALRARLGPRQPLPPAAPLSPTARPVLTLEVDAPPPGATTLPVARDASATTVPPILVDSGSDLVAIDPKSASVRWRLHVSRPSHAALVGDVLVVAVDDVLVAVDPQGGEERWRKDVPGNVVALDAGLGQVVALLREEGLQPRHRLVALDAFTSDVIWRKDLATSDPLAPFVPMIVAEEGVVVARRRKGPTGYWSPALTIHSLLTGSALAEVPCPTDGTMEPQYALAADGRTLLVASREDRKTRLEGWDTGTGRRRFSRPLETIGPRVAALLSDGDAAIVLDGSGRLGTYALADGEPRHATGVAGGLEPLFGSTPVVDDRRITLLVHERRQSATLVSFDRATGKAAWTVPFGVRVNGGALLRSGDTFIVVLAPQVEGRGVQGPLEYRVRLVSSEGKDLQEMTSTGVAGYRPVPVLEDGTLVLAGLSGICAWR